MDPVVQLIHLLSLTVYLIAFIAMIIFYNQLKHEKHWLGFPIALFFFTLHEFFEILHDDISGLNVIFNINTELFAEISEILGAIILTYSLYYLIKEITKINRLESQEDSEQD